ncbi:GrpB family protein [Bacillus licheniformis]|nr:GrpB family protein [Bacillus licheniformis]
MQQTGTRFDGRREQSQRSFSWIEPLQELGYEHVFHEAFPARRFFERESGGRAHAICTYTFSKRRMENQLRFRNYLRKHSVERQAYETLKKLGAAFPYYRTPIQRKESVHHSRD